jgi:hypothetical protein
LERRRSGGVFAFNKCCITQFIDCPYILLSIGARKAKERQKATARLQAKSNATPAHGQHPVINSVPSADQQTFADRELPLVKEKKLN